MQQFSPEIDWPFGKTLWSMLSWGSDSTDDTPQSTSWVIWSPMTGKFSPKCVWDFFETGHQSNKECTGPFAHSSSWSFPFYIAKILSCRLPDLKRKTCRFQWSHNSCAMMNQHQCMRVFAHLRLKRLTYDYFIACIVQWRRLATMASVLGWTSSSCSFQKIQPLMLLGFR